MTIENSGVGFVLYFALRVELSHAALDNKLDDKITLVFPSYSCKE
jgi:hypothetical protein